MIPHRPGQVWLSITGYGRSLPERVAFGDDAAVAGGLVGWTGANGQGANGGAGEPVFCADAIADPLTGACGALAVALSRSAGGGELIDLSMRDVAAAFAAALPLITGRLTTGRTTSCPADRVTCPRSHREQAVLRRAARHRPPAGAARGGTRRGYQRGARVARRRGRRMLIRGARVWPPDAHRPPKRYSPACRAPTCAWRRARSPSAGRACGRNPAKRSWRRPAGSCCPACTTITCTCGRSPPRRPASASARRRRGPAPNWPRGCARRTRTCPPARGCAPSVTTSRSPGALDRHVLDRLLPRRPVRVQHRTGALWVVNSLAAAQLGPRRGASSAGWNATTPGARPGGCGGWTAGSPTGCRSATADLGAVSRKAASLGITGFTDATPGATDGDLAFLAEAPIAQRICCMAPPGVRPPPGTVSVGPVKIMLDDTTLPSLDELADLIRGAHAAGRPAAVHCVTRVQFVLTLAALDLAGRLPGDRIEHGAVIGADSLPDLARADGRHASRTSSPSEASSTRRTCRRRTCLTCGGCVP